MSAFHLELLCLRGCLIFRYMTIVSMAKSQVLKSDIGSSKSLQFELTDLRPLMAQMLTGHHSLICLL